LERQIRELKAALKPFAMLPLMRDGEGPVWFYVGKPLENCRTHLHTDDFKNARRMAR
jgi:hypothetical protein